MSKSIDRRVLELLEMDDSELESLYGVEIYEDGVYDPVEDREFETLQQWAEFAVEQEDDSPHFVKNQSKYGYDDEG